MADLETRLRAAMESAVASEQPPGNLVELVRRRHRRHVRRATVAGAASVAVVAVLIPAGTRVLGHGFGPGPAGGHQRAASTVYVSFLHKLAGTVVPINAATNRPGEPIRIGGSLAVAPDGKTLYVSPGAWTIPVSTATNKPGKRIHVSGYLTIDPNGKIAYATGLGAVTSVNGTVTPVNLATNKPGKPIRVCGSTGLIAFTPDGKTAYVSCPTWDRAQ